MECAAVPFPCCKGGSGFTCLSSLAGPVSFSAIVADGSILPGASGILFCGGQIMLAIFPPCEQWRDSASHILCWCRNGISWQELEGVASHYAWCSLCASPAISIYKGTVGHQNVSCPSGSTIRCITDQIILWRSGTRFHSLADGWLFTARNLSLLLLEPKPYGGGVEHSRLHSSRLKWCNVGFFPGVGKQRAKAYSVGQAFGKLP